VEVPGLGGRLLLTGARPTDLLERLTGLVALEEWDIDVSTPIAQSGRAPSTVLLEADHDDVEKFARVAELAFEPTPGLLASQLPPMDLQLVADRRAPDLRYPHCLVELDGLRPRWGADDPEAASGLWLCRGLRRAEYYLRRDGEWWFFPTREYGPYVARPPELRPALLRYEEQSWRFYVAGRAPLPPLQARAATLCSGRLPIPIPVGDGDFDDRYVNVDPHTAAAVAASLGIELRSAEEVLV
jgi:hypothetical protein